MESPLRGRSRSPLADAREPLKQSRSAYLTRKASCIFCRSGSPSLRLAFLNTAGRCLLAKACWHLRNKDKNSAFQFDVCSKAAEAFGHRVLQSCSHNWFEVHALRADIDTLWHAHKPCRVKCCTIRVRIPHFPKTISDGRLAPDIASSLRGLGIAPPPILRSNGGRFADAETTSEAAFFSSLLDCLLNCCSVRVCLLCEPLPGDSDPARQIRFGGSRF
mmetsp:Transcript_110717/g.174529  ORF Transcript_110717/g.174529 Transcript_110717/m.174529 type:complete len:218 (+) Transcript_110717:852-1505(+)